MGQIHFPSHEVHLHEGVKHCPFCGKTSGLYIQGSDFYNELVEENGEACLVMGCKICDLNLTIFDNDDTSYNAMKKALISKWNIRKSSKNTRRNKYEH